MIDKRQHKPNLFKKHYEKIVEEGIPVHSVKQEYNSGLEIPPRPSGHGLGNNLRTTIFFF